MATSIEEVATTADEDGSTGLSGVEGVKTASNYLLDPLVAEFAAGGTHISEAGYQILKFHGSYQQDDRDLRNDRRKAGEEYAYGFMIRLRIPGGDIHPELWLALDRLAGDYGNGTLRLTTRQSVQLHGIPKGDLKAVIRAVNDNLASTLGACGDVNRNVMSAPAPLDLPAYRLAQDAARRISDHLLPRTRAYAELWLDGEELAKVGPNDGEPLEVEPIYGRTYLPRKFKTAVTVAGDNSVDLFTHDLGFVPILDDADRLEGWNVYVGGGLGRTHRKPETFPRLADPLGFVKPEDLLAAAEGVVRVQRDHGDRTNRRHARLKYLIHDRGIDWFRDQVAKVMGVDIEPARAVEWTRFDDRLGWHPQGDGRWFLGLRVITGRVADNPGRTLRSALREVAAELEIAYRVTPNQNVYLINVPPDQRASVDAIFERHGIGTADTAAGILRLAMACPALPTCGLAVTEAERALPDIVDSIQQVFEAAGVADAGPTLRVTGCPNGCARPYVAEIGLVGDAVDRYQLWLGGDLAGTRIATTVAERVHKDDLPDLLRPVIERYRDERQPDEGFGDFVTRSGITRLDYTPRPRPTRVEAPA
jgi:sulfite reductase (ferredoxin)